MTGPSAARINVEMVDMEKIVSSSSQWEKTQVQKREDTLSFAGEGACSVREALHFIGSAKVMGSI